MTLEEHAGVARHVTITGTRSVDARAEAQLERHFQDYLAPFAAPDATFYVGGAVGVDTAALDWLASNTRVGLIVVVPCAVANQPAIARDTIRRWLRQGRLSEAVELGASALGTSAYQARNRWMVDRSDFVLGFPRGTDSTSGTWYTLNYAADHEKPRLIAPV